MKPLRVRQYKAGDDAGYARTLLLTLPCKDLVEAGENVQLIVRSASEGSRELWVADSRGNSVGFMLLEFDDQKRFIEIDWLDVHPDYQRRGVGTALFMRAEESARAQNCQFITVHTACSNTRMREFGRVNGFEEVDRLHHFWGTGTEDAYLLRKSLHEQEGNHDSDAM